MDRIRIQRIFKRVLWTCPSCSQEDYEDRNMTGGNEYIHICSSCSKEFNQSCGAMREYNGCLSYTPEEYDTIKEEDVTTTKDTLVAEWVYKIKNPAPYVEPTKEQLEAELAEKQAEVDRLQEQIITKEAEIG